MVAHYHRLTNQFCDRVFDHKKVFLRAFVLLPLDLLVAPIAVGYYIIGRYILAKTFVASYKCNNCGVCMKQCPTHSIILSGGRPYLKFTCESCMRCMNYCPQRAIETAHTFVFGLLALFIYVLNPIFASFSSELVIRLFKGSRLADESINFIIQWSTMLFAFWAGYHLLHYAMRKPFLNKIITFTTFSTWKFWRRYHIPKEGTPSE